MVARSSRDDCRDGDNPLFYAPPQRVPSQAVLTDGSPGCCVAIPRCAERAAQVLSQTKLIAGTAPPLQKYPPYPWLHAAPPAPLRQSALR